MRPYKMPKVNVEPTYRDDITVLRALAVSLVIWFHLGIDFAPKGGFLGVDIFLVISGFLMAKMITSIKSKSDFWYGEFLKRRMSRIVPALFFMLFMTYIAAIEILSPIDFKEFLQSMLGAMTFTSHIYFYREMNYFGARAETSPLLHTWSLSIEALFYLLIATIGLFQARRSKKSLIISIPALILITTLSFLTGLSYFSTPLRFIQLCLGFYTFFFISKKTFSLLPLQEPLRVRIKSLLLFLLITLCATSSGNLFGSFFVTLLTTGYIALGPSIRKDTAKFVWVKHLVLFIGKISYSLYLFHYPVIAFGNVIVGTSSKGIGQILTSISLIILLSSLSYSLFEKSYFTRSRQLRVEFMSLLVFFILLIMVFVGFSPFFQKAHSDQYSTEQRTVLSLINESTGKDLTDEIANNSECIFATDKIDTALEEKYNFCRGKYDRAIFIMGDSHSINLYNIVAKSDLNVDYQFMIGLIKPACRVSQEIKCDFMESSRDFVNKFADPNDFILYHQSGSYLMFDRNGRFDTADMFARSDEFRFCKTCVDYIENWFRGFRPSLSPFFIGPFTEARIDLNEPRNWKQDLRINPVSSWKFRLLSNELSNYFKFSSRAIYIDFYNFIGIPMENRLVIDGCITFNDVDHYSKCYEDILAKNIRVSLITPIRGLPSENTT